MRKIVLCLGLLLLTSSALIVLAADRQTAGLELQEAAAVTSDPVLLSAGPALDGPLSSATAGAFQVNLEAGLLCLDCDTHADCNQLCGARGFFGGACLRDLDLVCGIYPSDKICSCF